jgi:hypothetical protein
MRSTRLAAPVLIAVLSAAGGIAHADGGYISAGAGPGAGLDGNISRDFTTDDSMNARLSLGQRIGGLAIEASLFGAGLVGVNDFSGFGREYDTLSLGVDLKYYFGLIGPLEIYPKIGVNRTWLTGGRDRYDYDGIGWDLGGGLQYSFDPVGIWLDFTHQRTRLRDDIRNEQYRILVGRIYLLSLGLAVSF